MDDRFDDHPKVLAILDEDDLTAAAFALSTWTLCFTWAHRNTRKKGQTPGLIPAGLPRRYFGREARAGVDLLVKYGMWDPHESGGWMIHDFEDYLPTDETREARSEAGKRGAAKRWAGHKKADTSEPPTDGSLPQTDSKLPSPSQDADNKTVATDGSRAPARRAISKEIAPTPTPTPVSPSASAPSAPGSQLALVETPEPSPPERPVKANDAVAHFLDAAKDAGLDKPTTGVINVVSRAAKRLLEKENVEPGRLLEAAEMCGANGWQSLDSALQKLSAERARASQNAQPRQSGSLARSNGIPRSTADERVADGIRLAQHFAEMDGQ